MPSGSKVTRMSIVAWGALVEGTLAILGANAEVKRFDSRRGFQVTVMESGKLLDNAGQQSR